MSTLTKLMIRVDPPQSHDREESERHYVGVHSAIARSGSLGDPSKVAYHTRKVLRQYDRLGSWNHRLTAWRFVTNLVLVADGEDPSSTLATVLAPAMVADVVNCVRDLRRCLVEETVLVDSRSGQAAGATYLFEYDRDEEFPAAAARDRLTQLAKSLAELMSGQQGARLLTLNVVEAESETEAKREPGQLFTGRIREETDKVGYLEAVFDSAHWGDLFFARAEVANLLNDDAFKTAAGYHVAETIEFDRR